MSSSDVIYIPISGRIDSKNAQVKEKEIQDCLKGKMAEAIVLDAEGLEYISSAGLRVLLRMRNKVPDITMINVCDEVYHVLEMTGFTEILSVERKHRFVSVNGCEMIGKGATGVIYRIDPENVVKVYSGIDTPDAILSERKLARMALILGLPTAISYDVVKTEEGYGAVFELLNCRTLSSIIAKEPDRFEWCVREYTDLLKKIHGIAVPKGKLPDMKAEVLSWTEFLQEYLPETEGKKLMQLVRDIPGNNHMIHGDYHTRNVELQNDEIFLIDMATLSVGDPVFELGFMYNSFIGRAELDHDEVLRFQGYDYETAERFWRRTLAAYLGTEDEEQIRETQDKARVIAYARLVRHAVRKTGLDTEKGKREFEYYRKELLELLGRVDSVAVGTAE